MKNMISILVLIFFIFSNGCQTERRNNQIPAILQRNLNSCVQVKTLNENINCAEEVASPEGAGTGFFIDEEGHILTNYHIIAHAKKIFVYMQRAKAIPAEVVAIDPVIDLAIIKIEKLYGSKAYQNVFDWHEAVVGAHVTFCASPLNLFKSTLYGRISSTNRILNHDLIQFLQIECNASRGASGAAVTDMSGAFLGILTKHALRNPNVGFVIPPSYCVDFVRRFREKGVIYSSWLGLELLYVSDGTESKKTLLISEIFKNSPASNSDLKVGYKVSKIDGIDTSLESDSMKWKYYFYSKNKDEQICFTVIDNKGKSRNIPVKAMAYKYSYPHEFYIKDIGAVVKRSTPFGRFDKDTAFKSGLIITRIIDPGLASEISVGDIISEEIIK